VRKGGTPTIRRSGGPNSRAQRRVSGSLRRSRSAAPPHESQQPRSGSVSGNWDEAELVPPQQLDADAILRTLLDHEVEFVVIGGLAVAAHGFPRATKAIEIVPAPTPENRRRLYEALRGLDAEPLEIGDFRADEVPVPFAPEGLEEGGNWALRTSAG
jgi:hypothetical protein